MYFLFCVICCSLILLCILALIPKSKGAVHTVELTPLEFLERETFLRACEGNKGARDWVMEHVIDKEKVEKVEKASYSTPQNEINDSISALVKLGYNVVDAKKLVYGVVKLKTYKNSAQIIIDCMRKK